MALFAFTALAMPAMSLLAGQQLAKNARAALVPRYWFTIARGSIVALAVLAIWHWLGRPFGQLGLDIPMNIRGQAGFLAVAIGAAVAGFRLTRVRKISNARLEKSLVSLRRLKILPRTPGELTVFMLVAVTAGIWEELVYRGFLIWYLRPEMGLAGAAAISAVIFGIGHVYQGWRGVIATGLVGLGFGLFYALTLSLWWLMAAHALIDVYGGLVAFQLNRMAARNSPNGDTLG